ncbi:YbbR-like domain-containing protein [Changchengzhania lutea]|uniref:YbbR-like domain-containing protein n=1 Tax=Changchengzhania lutea TaxID=2049305 RepID=UPI001FE9E056|nr:YbbR-like domain-containing protein [Changchengzhania lutea]
MIKKLKSNLITSIKNRKINVFILFLVSAFVILIFLKLSKEYTNTLVFDIDKINVPQENVILNDSSIRLNVTLKTHGFKWLKYYFSKPKIVVDFSKDVNKKDSMFVWSKSKSFLENTQFDKQIELLNIFPDTLVFRYDVNLVKKIPVILISDIEFSNGYDMTGDFNLKPDSVEVIGPKVLVSKMDSIATKKLVLGDVKLNLNEILELNLPDNNKDLIFPTKNINVSATVEKFTEGTLKVPVSVVNVPKGIDIKYFPKEVNISYYVSLSAFNTISVKDFEVICDYSKVIENQNFLVPELNTLTDQVKNVKLHQQRIEFIISK